VTAELKMLSASGRRVVMPPSPPRPSLLAPVADPLWGAVAAAVTSVMVSPGCRPLPPTWRRRSRKEVEAPMEMWGELE
jgi:hypothetical protein